MSAARGHVQEDVVAAGEHYGGEAGHDVNVTDSTSTSTLPSELTSYPSSPLSASARNSHAPASKSSSSSPQISSSRSADPAIASAPTLVNPLPSPIATHIANTMRLPLSALSPTSPRSHPRSRPKTPVVRPPIPSPPDPKQFSFASILAALDADTSAQADIDAIAEICGRSRLSRADEYGAHRNPVGPVIVGAEGDAEDDEDGVEARAAALSLPSTAVHFHHATSGVGPGGLETVEERSIASASISSASDRARKGTTEPNTAIGSSVASDSNASAVSAKSRLSSPTAADGSQRWAFVGLWERGLSLGGLRGSGTSGAVGGFSPSSVSVERDGRRRREVERGRAEVGVSGVEARGVSSWRSEEGVA